MFFQRRNWLLGPLLKNSFHLMNMNILICKESYCNQKYIWYCKMCKWLDAFCLGERAPGQCVSGGYSEGCCCPSAMSKAVGCACDVLRVVNLMFYLFAWELLSSLGNLESKAWWHLLAWQTNKLCSCFVSHYHGKTLFSFFLFFFLIAIQYAKGSFADRS